MPQKKCDACQEVFNRQSSLTRHKNHFHSGNSQKIECSICSKNFSRKDLLLRHERLHRGEGLKPCQVCHREFRGDYLARHERGCRLRQAKPSSGTPTTGLTGSIATQRASEYHHVQWQEPKVAPFVKTSKVIGIQSTGRRVQQPHRYVLLKILNQSIKESQLLDQAVCETSHWRCNTSLLRATINAWQAQGLSVRRLDELSVRKDGLTLIAHACENIGREGVEFILTLDLDFNLQDVNGRTALHCLIQHSAPHHVSKIMSKTADIDARDVNLDTPLCLASKLGDVEVMKLLCDHGADVNASMAYIPDEVEIESLPQTPLENAICSGSDEAVSMLLRKGADPNLKGERLPLETAILSSDSSAMELLLDAGADPYLIEAYFVDLLLDGDDASSERDVAISQAKQKHQSLDAHAKDHRPSRRALFRSFDLVDDQTDTMAIIAVDDIFQLMQVYDELRQADIIVGELKSIIETWPLDAPDNLVMRASSAGALRCLRFLLRYWPDLDLTGFHGRSALHYACSSGNDQIVRLLLEHGANIESCSEKGETPLCLATKKGHLEIMTTLLDAGANVNGSASLGHSSPLHVACAANQRDAVTLLLSRNADVELGCGRISPLETALWLSSAETVSILLRAGASTRSISRLQWTRGLRALAERSDSSRVPEPAEKARLLEATPTKAHSHKRGFRDSDIFGEF